MLTRILLMAQLWFTGWVTTHRKRDERGEAVPWLIVIGAGIGIAYFAGDSIMAFARDLVAKL